ncbi:MAG: hypothetical protein ACHQXL_01060 [Candidatus Limnocylindrales bacterium]|jgi:hypothetical protein
MRDTPMGVLLLGLLMVAQGALTAFWGTLMMGLRIFDLTPSGTGVFWIGLFSLLVGLVQVGVGVAAWRLRPWAWLVGWILAVAGLIGAFFGLLATGSLAYAVAEGLFPIIVFWYLNQAEVKKAFLSPTES